MDAGRVLHAEVSVVVDGAVEQDGVVFFDEVLLREFVAGIEEEARGDGYWTQVFVLWHEHEVGIECECVQYVQSHKPYAEFNAEVV